MKVEITVGETLRRFLFILHLPKWQAGRPAYNGGVSGCYYWGYD